MDKRYIRCVGNSIGKDESYLHPIFLTLYKNTDEDNYICPTELYNNNNPVFFKKTNKKYNYSKEELSKFMEVPYISFGENLLLEYVYNIYNIDDLITFINKSIEQKYNFIYINRIINTWIYDNAENINKNHKIIIKIFTIIKNTFWDKLKVTDFDDKVLKFTKKFFDNKYYDDFNFDFGKDLYKYLKK
jgi:hypothetical protein